MTECIRGKREDSREEGERSEREGERDGVHEGK
jgi:hypothetical protein